MKVNRVSNEKKLAALRLARLGLRDVGSWTAREARLAAFLRDLLDDPNWRNTEAE